jgi:gas vesicle protein
MNNKAKIITAVAVGAAVGSALGVLFAPEKGKDTRKKIKDKTNELARDAKNTFYRGKEKLAASTNTDKDASIDHIDPIL